ncbi:RNA exonuclease 1 homolog [Agrilus planipennis]|uniref:RNA exonuclease 1 homolog n=1 Tax=Agrilus planipennis TaxID=224129 RepID=A0A1W4WA75_AGRPL|nr:RNA exonuclease 1 homolog [Agrilus planipennis]
MLPTTGRFKDITCPYLETSCGRPYCHFSHKKKSQDEPSTVSEVPTYNPTPKSQLLHTKSHIPISYVPDIISRTDRSNSRFNSILERSQQVQPIYKPTPLSILSSTQKLTISSSDQTDTNKDSSEQKQQLNNDKSSEYNPESCNINFEELSTEFDLIDEIINTSESEDEHKSENSKLVDKETGKVEKKTVQKEKLNKVDSSSSKKGKNTKSEHKGDKKKDDDKHSSEKSDYIDKKSSDKHDKKSSHKSNKKSSDRKTDENNRKYVSEKGDKKRGDDKSKKKSSSSSSSKERSNKHSTNAKAKDKHRHKSKTKDSKQDKKENVEDEIKKKENKKEQDVKIKDTKAETKACSESLFDDGSSEIYDDSHNNFDSGDDLLDIEEDDDVMKECYKIFNEYKPTEPEIEPKITKLQTIEKDDELEYIPTSKKRIAHDKAESITPRIVNKPKTGPNPALMMANRLKMARLAQAANEHKNLMAEISRQEAVKHSAYGKQDENTKSIKNHGIKRPPDKVSNGSSKQPKINSDASKNSSNNLQKTRTLPSTSSSLIDDILAGKAATSTTNKQKRIAPAMNVNSIQRAKAKLEEIAKQRAATLLKTPSQTFGKGGKRVAHVPEYSLTDIPDVMEAERSKLPVNVRTRYLTMIADECVKLYLTKNDAYQRALREEFKCYERCSVLATYRNSTMLAVNRLRKEVQDMEKSGQGPLGPGEESFNTRDINTELKGRKLYKNIERFILSEEELNQHAFPREGPVPGVAVIVPNKQIRGTHLEYNERQCCRCWKIYRVDREGFAVYEEECVYHPLKKRTLRGESIYLCCKSTDELGCATAPCHVCDTPVPGEYDLEGYQTTFPPEDDDDPRSHAIYALDCEMCYTTKGLELTRVTIVNPECQTVYETLVKPMNPIIDYNTRFSGITKDQMDRTATTILQVQANILHLCNSKTILIGHSLESDMRALKIIHNTIVDTSVLFPHKLGLPHKRALRVLASEYLQKIIQNDMSGHDSAEDALTCMELVIWKIKEELKSRGIKS